jgi:hypothetical protein
MAFTWIHSDSRGLPAAVQVAIARARARDVSAWAPSSESIPGQRVAAVRALAVASLYLANEFSTAPPPSTVSVSPEIPSALQITLPGETQFASKERKRIIESLLGPWFVLANMLASDLGDDVGKAVSVVTKDGEAPVDLAPTAQGWGTLALGGVAIIAAAAVYCYIATKAAEVVDNELSRRESTRRMMATQADVLAIFEAHREKEKQKGAEIPLSSAEKAALDSVVAATNAAAADHTPPISSPFPAGADLGTAIKAAAFTTPVVIVIAIALYLFTKKG